MNILGLQVTRPGKDIPKTEERGSLEDYLAYFGIPLTADGSNINYTTAMTISAVYKSVALISDSIASLPIEPYKLVNGIYEVNHKSPTYNILNVEPHPMYGKVNFWKLMVSNMLLHGNGYAYIVRDQVGNPINMIPFYPPDVEIYVNVKDYKLKYKIIDRDGFIELSDMIHIAGQSVNGYSGISAVEYGSRSLGIAVAGDKTAKGFFDNGANASGIIKVDGRIDSAKATAIKNAWNTAFSPYNEGSTPGGVAVLENGMDYQPVSVDPVSSQLLESRQYSVEEVARWFNLPASKLGITSGLNYNSIEQNNLEYLQTTLNPIIEKIENEMARKFFKPSDRTIQVVKVNESAILRSDLNSRVSYLSKMVESGLMSINEGRKTLDLPAVDNGDELIIKSGNQPLSKLLTEPEPAGTRKSKVTKLNKEK